MPQCKSYVSSIVVRPSVSGLYHDRATEAAFVPCQQNSKSCKLEAAPLWSSLGGAFSNTYQTCVSTAGKMICIAWLPQLLITSEACRLSVTAETLGHG